MSDTTFGMYIHVPFCLKKCDYCDFYSLTDYSLEKKYITALCRHMEIFANEHPCALPYTIYIGGGTPTSLSTESLEALLSGISKYFDISRVKEYTIEANPATVDSEKLELLKANKVTRLSIGMQSSHDSELMALSRIHTFDDFSTSYFLAKKYINDINVDIMSGIPRQTRKSLSQTLDTIIAIKPQHISAYLLKIEKGTPFFSRQSALGLPDEDTCSDMYLDVSKRLSDAGYLHYEISNFALDGHISIHNTGYWKRREYIGLGPAAHSFFGGVRYSYRRSLVEYIDNLASGRLPPFEEYSVLSDKDAVNEEIMLSLRLSSGLDISYLKEKTGYDILKENEREIREFVSNGFASLENGVLRLSEKGFAVSNYIISGLLL